MHQSQAGLSAHSGRLSSRAQLKIEHLNGATSSREHEIDKKTDNINTEFDNGLDKIGSLKSNNSGISMTNTREHARSRDDDNNEKNDIDLSHEQSSVSAIGSSRLVLGIPRPSAHSEYASTPPEDPLPVIVTH